jgi:hypothetical protein
MKVMVEKMVKMTRMISSSSYSFKKRFDRASYEIDSFIRVLPKLRTWVGLLMQVDKELDSRTETIDCYYTRTFLDNKEDTALRMAALLYLDRETVQFWLDELRTIGNSDHPEVIEEFLSIYSRYFEQFDVIDKGDRPNNDGGDDGESSPKTPSPDLLSV